MQKHFAAALFGVAVCLAFLAPSDARGAGSPIDRIDLSTIFGYAETYDPAGGTGSGLDVIGTPQTYYLHDGRSWGEGAGSLAIYTTKKSSVTTTGNQIDYLLDMPVGAPVYYRIDYDSGNDSSYGQMISTAPLVLHATAGSKTATLTGYAQITVNQPANYTDDRFHYFNAPVGAWAPFSLTYTLSGAQTWSATTMDSSFQYTMAGYVDFTQAIVPEPASGCAVVGLLAAALHRRRRVAR